MGQGAQGEEGGAVMTPVVLQATRTGLPTREQMKRAIERGLEGIIFRVEYLSAPDDLTLRIADQGGLDRNADTVAYSLEEASWLVRMYDGLCGEESEEEEQERPATPAA